MDNIDSHLVKSFFNNSCTSHEAARVLEWLDTPVGQLYLEEQLDADIKKFEDTNLHLVDPELDSEAMYNSIEQQTTRSYSFRQSCSRKLAPLWRVAALLLLGMIGSVFYYTNYYESPTAQKEPIYYETGADQQRELTLADGTHIRLNSNSRIWISPDFLSKTRNVRMEGEAYFDVAHNPERPFFIKTDRASIEVLGTAFNVKSTPSNENVQVAVVEGTVSVSSTREDEKNNSVVLAKGQFGFLGDGEFSVENFGVENYLAWMKGRLIFENLTLSQVCTQLTRLYDIDCKVEDSSIKDLNLTTNISSVSSFEKVLSVISLSLNINYKKSNNQVMWYDKK